MAKASIPQLLHKRVSIRRSGKVIRDVLTQLLVSEIRQGRLKKDDEISPDEQRWVRLDQHHQLAKYFPAKSSTNSGEIPDLNQRLTELSEMLEELSQ